MNGTVSDGPTETGLMSGHELHDIRSVFIVHMRKPKMLRYVELTSQTLLKKIPEKDSCGYLHFTDF